MFRINLLPQEVLERRRYEGWYRWVIILAVGMVLIILGVYALLMFDVASKNAHLQTIQESTTQQNNIANQLSIFQSKEQELQERQSIAQTALAGRVNVGRVLEDVSLVLPDEVWLDLLTVNESTGVMLSAQTPRNAGESNDVAYKSVAKTLVRLNELPDLYDVWLSTALNDQWSAWAAASADQQSNTLPVNVVKFQASTKIDKSAAPVPGTHASAPSTQTPTAAASAAVSAANAAGTK
jgi:Tfp pilus assembly protein PilN